MHFEYYPVPPMNALVAVAAGIRQQWRWRLKGDNGETIASGEAYHNKADCLHAIALMKSTNVHTAVMETFA